MPFAVIGAGAAGLQAACRLRELGKEVVLIAREERAYSLCSLPYVLSGECPEERIYTHDAAELEKMGIQPLLGRELQKILPSGKRVRLDDGSEVPYDGLLLATGSVPWTPAGLGSGVPGMYPFNSLEDTRRLVEAAGKARSAIVLGAGFTGLECAHALRLRGLEVSVVEMERRVLPRILDPDMSPAVEKVLESNGVSLRLGRRVLGAAAPGGQVELELQEEGRGAEKRERLRADLAVTSLGVRPDLAIARAAGLATGRGILVGPDMQTSVPGIYAAGDAAEFEGQIPATWLTAANQGMVAASNLAGVKASFTHLDQVNIATLFGVPVVGIGAPAAQLGKAFEQKSWRTEGVWRKLITVEGRVAGFQSVGDLGVRGLVSLLTRELAPEGEGFARAGFHHPAIPCARTLGRPGPGALAGSHLRRKA